MNFLMRGIKKSHSLLNRVSKGRGGQAPQCCSVTQPHEQVLKNGLERYRGAKSKTCFSTKWLKFAGHVCINVLVLQRRMQLLECTRQHFLLHVIVVFTPFLEALHSLVNCARL